MQAKQTRIGHSMVVLHNASFDDSTVLLPAFKLKKKVSWRKKSKILGYVHQG